MMVSQEELATVSHGSMNIEAILKKLVSLRSFVPYENEPYSFLNSFLRNQGFKVTKQLVSENRFNILAERGKGKNCILFYMHLDTVSPPRGYLGAPLELRKNGDKFFGLGCFDMKGGIAALLSILNSSEFQNRKIKLAFCIDEEGLSEGVYKLINSAFIKDVAVAFCPEACIVPPDWSLPIMIIIGGRGRCVVEIKVPGKTVHGAQDLGGINAIEQSVILIKNLYSFRSKNDLNMGKGSFFVRSIHSNNKGLSIPDLAIIEVDYQLVLGESPKSIEVNLKAFIKNLYQKNILDRSLQGKLVVQLKQRKTPYISPYVVSKNNSYVRLVENLSRFQFGKADFDYTKSVADQNVLANTGVPIITIGPIGGNAHQVEEWVSASSLKEVANFYKKLCGNCANS